MKPYAALLFAIAGCAEPGPATESSARIAWRDFTPELFADAREQDKLVLLDLGTGWCHWCHVMEETTYRDHRVLSILNRRYLAAKVDADARVDLANRYEAYGWPATIIFDAEGTELAKLRGYLAPERAASLFQAFADDPTPGPSALGESGPTTWATSSALPPELRDELLAAHVRAYDPVHAGFGDVLKYLPEWSVELDLELARRGDEKAAKRARATLTAALELVDPAWGGVYQYSHGGDWDHPHFEKVMSFQGLNLRLYAQAFALFGDEAFRKAADDVRRYLVTFLRAPDGAFFASQDADLVEGEHGGEYFALDDAGRRKLGIPEIDRSVYARENGFAIEGLALFHAMTGDALAREQAEAAARAILASRRVEGGGFRHGESDREARYLGDTLAMGIALFELHATSGSGSREWLDAAVAAADCIARSFGDGPGFPNALPVPDATGALPKPQRDENLALARFANRLFHATGEERFKEMVERAMRYLVTPEIARERPAAAVVLVAAETNEEPLHVVIVAPHGDAAARGLFARALREPTRHKLVQSWSPKEDPPLPGGAAYPESDGAAAYVCTAVSCSPPVYDADSLGRLLNVRSAR